MCSLSLSLRSPSLSLSRYAIWFGDDESNMPTAAKLENAIFMPWARDVHTNSSSGAVSLGEIVPFPGILYREILSQGQVFDDDDCDYHHGVGDVLKDVCGWPEGIESADAFNALMGRRELRSYCYDDTCCGDRPPECCRDRRHLKSVMREYYPSVEYFRVDRWGNHFELEEEEEEEATN